MFVESIFKSIFAGCFYTLIFSYNFEGFPGKGS